MRYLRDTTVYVRYLNGRSRLVRDRLLSGPTEDMVVCSVVKAELCYGAMRSSNPIRTLERKQQFLRRFISLPFDDEAAMIYAQIRACLAHVGTPIGACDLQIAAIALVHNLTLVTHNTREFHCVDQLQVEDWEIEV